MSVLRAAWAAPSPKGLPESTILDLQETVKFNGEF